jgi:hypothetical protein
LEASLDLAELVSSSSALYTALSRSGKIKQLLSAIKKSSFASVGGKQSILPNLQKV